MSIGKSLYKDQTDEALMKSIMNHDEHAFDEIYQRYSRRMLHYFYRMLNQNQTQAQDFMQDLFVKIIEQPHRFNPERKFSTWIYTIASNMCKNEYRSREVRKKVSSYGDLTGFSPLIPSSENEIDHRQFFRCLETELDNLSTNHKEVFLFRYQEGLSIKEISQIMACSEGTVKSRVFYALKKLAGSLQVFNPKER